MRRPSPVRRLLAVAAAYAVALQLVLLPLSVAAGTSQAASLCSELASEQTGLTETNPAAAMDGCGCASGCGMQCCSPAFGGPLSAITITSIDRTSFVVLTPKTRAAVVGSVSWRGPQNPRAPPQPAA